MDRSWGTELDLNGDGIVDLAIGARGGPFGRLDVYYGSSSGLPLTPSISLSGRGIGDDFGLAVASAGDLNGDGFGDIVVGAPQSSPGGRVQAGRVSVYFGSPSGVRSVEDWFVEGEAARDLMGHAVSSAGDVNGDGFADLLVGAPRASAGGRAGVGTASLFYGSSEGILRTPSRVLAGEASEDGFGWSLAEIGDANNDGFADVAVGACFSDPSSRMNAGTGSVFYGTAGGAGSTPSRVLGGANPGDGFGCEVAGGGDLNGDGRADLIVGASSAAPRGMARAGTAYIFFAGSDGIQAAPGWTANGSEPSAAFGTSVSGAGDVNRDGVSDLVIGSPGASHNGRLSAGTASLFLGSRTGVETTPSRAVGGIAERDYLGVSVSLSDVNGDGYFDLVAGAYNASPGGRESAGSASLYLSSPTGLPTSATRIIEGAQASEQLGWTVASLRGNATRRAHDSTCSVVRAR